MVKFIRYIFCFVLVFCIFFSPVLAVVFPPSLSINLQGPSYPILGSRTLPEGTKKAKELGFQTIEIYIGMGMCWINPQYPNGLYQTYELCNKDGQGMPISSTKSILEYAQHSIVKETIDLPFSTIIIDTDASLSTSANIQHARLLTYPLPATRLQGTYNEFYDLSRYLLSQYSGLNKTFIISTPNELDWQMLPTTDPTLDPTDSTILNAIDYLNTISKAIIDAKRNTASSNVKLYHACEANLLQKALKGGKTAVNNVFPFTQCDLYGYSADDTIALDNNPTAFTTVLDYYSSKVPDSADFGNKNVYISEVSGATNYTPPEASLLQVNRMNKALQQSLDWGVPYFGFWQLYANCSVENPTSPVTQCIPNWLIKPNGEPSDIYNQVYLPRQIHLPSPTEMITVVPLTPIHKKGDANNDGEVNGVDYVVWLNNYLQTVTSGIYNGDFDENGIVNGVDYVIWLNNYSN